MVDYQTTGVEVMRSKRWEVIESNQGLAKNLADELGLGMITAQLLVNRGVRNRREAESFFALNLEDLHDPYLFSAMEKAIDRLLTGLENAEKIVIFGDYDVDGITGTSLLFKVFRQLSTSVDYYIPDRSEGYGLNKDIVQRLALSGYTLIVTVDNGISSLEEVELANSLGMEVIITDHHEPPKDLPAASAILNPKLKNSGYPFAQLSGVGVAFKLCQALALKIKRSQLTELVENQLDLVALGTVADIVPILGENRVIVTLGLKQFSTTANLGLQCLLQVANLEDKKINTGHLGYLLGPRINAIGRLDNPMFGVELFTTPQLARATELANKLDQANRKRQLIEETILQQAIEMIEKADLNTSAAIVLASAEWHPGVIGIVASKLVDKFYRPTILIALKNGVGKGSARGIKGLDLFQALNHCQKHLMSYGGHEMAAGLTISPEKVAEFSQAFRDFVNQKLTPTDFVPLLKIDLEVDLSDLNFDLLAEVERFEPHGFGNGKPTFVVREVAHQGRIVGSTKEHLRIKTFKNNQQVMGIGFGLAVKQKVLKSSSKIDIAFTLNRNIWQERVYLQMSLLDLVAAEVYGEELDLLKIVDQRNLEQRDEYLKKLIEKGEKMIIFVNNRSVAQKLLQMLKKNSPKIAKRLAVYQPNFEDWQSGHLTALIITDDSIRDEQVFDMQHVVHYDLPFSIRQFAQRFRSVNRVDAWIHLLYGDQEKKSNQINLAAKNPHRDLLVQVYRILHRLADHQGIVDTTIDHIIQQLELDGQTESDPLGIINTLDIFQELNLFELPETSFGDSLQKSASCRGRLLPRPAQKLDLKSSIRYNEGIKEREDFTVFAELALSEKIDELLKTVKKAVS